MAMKDELHRSKLRLKWILAAWTLALGGLLGIFTIWAGSGLAQGDKGIVEFDDATHEVEVLFNQEIGLPLTLTLSKAQTTPVTVHYNVSSDDLTADDITPFGDHSLTITPTLSVATIMLSIRQNTAWITGTRTVVVTLKDVEPADKVVLGDVIMATATLHRRHKAFIPLVHNDKAWRQVNPAPDQTGIRSLAVCPTDSTIRYLASGDGLFRWQAGEWKAVKDMNDEKVPGNAREISFGEDCDNVYAAVLDSGVWREKNRGNNVWEEIDPGDNDDDLRTSRTVVVHDNWLYTGTDTGIFYTNLSSREEPEWEQRLPSKIITRLTLGGDRIYATVWTEGVAYSNNCPATCEWIPIAVPPDATFGRDVLGPALTPEHQAPEWLLLATANTVHWYDGQTWHSPTATAKPEPTGNVFTLAQVNDDYYAGIENGGVWVSSDGLNWERVGTNLITTSIRDLAVTTDGELFAAAYDTGVWQYRPPPAQQPSKGATP